ncbi:MAG: hypothetical protein JWM02_697 [Frankiales bacterium]|nr:hypothetical protein [Frankiales bacterium]
MNAAVVALGVAVLLLSVLVAGLLRSHAEILRALHELGAGLELDKTGAVPITPEQRRTASTPDTVVGRTLGDEVVAVSLLGGETLIAFLSSGCSTCQGFWKAFRHEVRDVPGGARLLVVTRGLDEESPSALMERQPTVVPLVLSDEAWDAFEVPGAPYFAYVNSSGRVIGEGTGNSWKQVVELMTQARADAALQIKGSGAVRDGRDSLALQDAGIEPGHPSLYGESA